MGYFLWRYPASLLEGGIEYPQNNWVGIERNAVGLSKYSPTVSQREQAVLNQIREELVNGKESIFSGTIYDRAGNERCKEGETISDDALLDSMDWLVKGVDVLD